MIYNREDNCCNYFLWIILKLIEFILLDMLYIMLLMKLVDLLVILVEIIILKVSEVEFCNVFIGIMGILKRVVKFFLFVKM